MLRHWLRDTTGTLVDISDRCRLYTVSLQENAEEGSVAVNTVVIDDPDGDLTINGHKNYAVEETEAEDPEDRFVFVGFIGTTKVRRGPYRTGVSREWACEVSDVNTMLSRRVMTGSDNDRPEESDNERIAWWLSTNEGEAFDDTRYVTTDDPEEMDDVDYTTQPGLAVVDDCAQQSGKNYFVTYFGDTATGSKPWGLYAPWYGKPEDGAYVSSGRLTNVLADVDGAVTFEAGIEDELGIDPMRIYSKVVVPYNGGYVKAVRPKTADNYARRDVTMPAENIKRKARAQRRANRYANDLNRPDYRATVSVYVPRSKVNIFRPGMAVQVKMSHWPGFEDWTYMRILNRRVTEVSEAEYKGFRLYMELSASAPDEPAEPVSGILYRSQGPEAGNDLVHWDFPGDTPGPGYVLHPTTGALEVITDGSPPHPSYPYSGWKVTGTGTIDVRFFATFVGVLINDTLYTITFSIRKNGSVVASEVVTRQGSLQGTTGSATVTVTGLSVEPDDEITATLSCTPSRMPFFRTPAGTGQNGESLEITGGSLS